MTLGELWRRLTFLLHRERSREELEEEMRLHQALRAQSHQARGMTSADAAAAARREFGNPVAIEEASQAIWGAQWVDDLLHDLHYAIRSIAGNPLPALAIAITLALGIGASATIFSLLDHLFIRAPQGVASPDELRTLFQTNVDQRILSTPTRWAFSYGDLQAVRQAAQPSLPIAGYTRPWPANLSPIDVPDVAPTYVADDYFGLLGVRPELGRLMTPEETRPEVLSNVAVISHHFWIAAFGGDRNVLGRTISVDGHPYTVIGVAANGFRGINLAPADLWLPLSAMILNRAVGGSQQRDVHAWYNQGVFLQIVMRVSSEEQSRSLASVATSALRAADPGDTISEASLLSTSESFRHDAGGSVVSITTRLAGVALILLFIASANIATLLLARGVARRHELAVRLALGASRWRIVRQLLTENLLLALLGGVSATVVATWSSAALRNALLVSAKLGTPNLEGHLLVFALAITLVLGIGTALTPAWALTRHDLSGVLHGGVRAGVRQRSGFRKVLVACQSTLCVMLLAGAGLFVRSLVNVRAVDIGYTADRLVLAHVPYDQGESIMSLGGKLPDLATRVAGLPGVERVALTANPMLTVFRGAPVFLPGTSQTLNGKQSHISFVSPEYFATVGTRILAGRSFLPSDRQGSEPVVIVSQSLATAAWPGDQAIGKCLTVAQQGGPCRTVIGIAADVHVRRIVEEPSQQVYLPVLQMGPFPGSAMVIRAIPEQVPAVATQTQRIFADAFGGDGRRLVQTMGEALAPELRPWRLGAGLFSAVALVALLIAAVGIYSSVAYGVTERTREMGVRVALGARRSSILRLVVGQGLSVVVLGLMIGVVATLALGKLVATMLYGIRPNDLPVLFAVCVVLISVALVACLIPAWRAMRVDPAEVLRAE